MRSPALALAAVALLAAPACRHGKEAPPAPTPEATRAPRAPERPPPTSGEKGGVPPEGERPRVPASPDALLGEGAVHAIQDALSARGLLAAHEPGVLDDATAAALRKVQREEGLAETGFPDRETVRRLGVDPEKAYGKVREEVGKGKE